MEFQPKENVTMKPFAKRGQQYPLLLMVALMTQCIVTPASSCDDTSDKLSGRNNLEQTPIGNSGQWSLEKLLALSSAEGMAIWRKSPAPSLQELRGHYMGIIPNADNVAEQKKNAAMFFSTAPGAFFWLGKAFRPISDTEGEGYTRSRFPDGKVYTAGHIKTYIGKSSIDGKDAYICDFSPDGGTLIDELRKVDDFIYFGASTIVSSEGKREPAVPAFFVLIGPTDEWVGRNISNADIMAILEASKKGSSSDK